MELSEKYKNSQELFDMRVRILNLFSPVGSVLTEMELRIVSFILRNYPEGTNFREIGRRDAVIKNFHFSRSAMSTHFKVLHKKKWMIGGRLDPGVEKIRYFRSPSVIKITLLHEPTTRKERP